MRFTYVDVDVDVDFNFIFNNRIYIRLLVKKKSISLMHPKPIGNTYP